MACKKGLSGQRTWSERGQGAPQIKGNSHGAKINVIFRVRASGAMRLAHLGDAKAGISPCAKFEKACAEIDRKALGLTGWILGTQNETRSEQKDARPADKQSARAQSFDAIL